MERHTSTLPSTVDTSGRRPRRSSSRGGFRHALFAVVGVASLLVLGLAGCGGSTSSPQGATIGGTLNVGLNADVVTLDPLKSSALVDRQVMLNIYDTLVLVNEKNEVKPDLATEWTYTTPTQLDLTLRTDVKFQDGTPFNADAVVFNINRILTTASSPRHSELATVTAVQATDPSHVRFTLKSAFSPLLATLTDRAGMILSPTALQATGADIANAPTNAGSGPFQFKTWVKGDHLTIARNPGYWQKDSSGKALPYLDAVNYRPITNGSVMATNLQTGTIQVAQALDPTDIASAKSNPDLVYNQIPGLSFFGFELNNKAAPLNDVHVRRAISFAVNRDEVLSNVLLNIGVVANGPVSPSSWAYSKSVPYTHDIDKAKAELAQASGGPQVSFALLVPSGSPLNDQEAQLLQSELTAAGITMAIKPETFATVLSDTAAHNYQAALIGWSGRPDPDGNTYNWFHTGGGFNDMQYSNTQVDTLLEDARASSDQTKRATDYQQAEQLILQDAPYVFLNHGVSEQATTKKVKNFLVLPTSIMIFTNVYLEK